VRAEKKRILFSLRGLADGGFADAGAGGGFDAGVVGGGCFVGLIGEDEESTLRARTPVNPQL